MSNFDQIDQELLSKNGKIIHQVWFGTIPNKRSAKKAYESMKYYRDSWKIHNPTWYHFEWNKEMCKNLVSRFFTEHSELFEKYEYEIQKCDAIRYLILYRYGGLYADMDYFCNQPFDNALKKYKNDIYLVQSPNGTIFQDNDHISNSLMYSRPKHPFWKTLMIEMERRINTPIYYTKHLKVMFTTGPGIVNRVYSKYKYRYKVKSLPYEFFHPYGISSDIRSTKLSDKIYTAHISKGSWSTKDTALFNTVIREWKIILFILLFLIINLFLYYRKI